MFRGILILCGLGLSFTSNVIFGSKIGFISSEYDTGFTPKSPAFAIWSLIYIGLIATGISEIIGSDLTDLYTYMLFAALICMSAWVPAFIMSNFVLSTGFLWMATCLSCICARLTNQFTNGDIIVILCINVPTALLAGWLIVASSLGTLIVLKKNNYSIPWTSPILIANLIGTIGIAIQNPVLFVPGIWAIALMKCTRTTITALILVLIFCGCSLFLQFRIYL